MAAIAAGSWKTAFGIFTGLADYEDAAEKAYALGISQFASMTWQNEKAASFRFHDQYGLINFDSNHVTAPQFESLSILSDNCFKVRKNNLYGLIDADGNQLAPCDFYDITALGDHTAVAANQQIDNSGWWTVYSYTFALLSENGRAEVQSMSGWHVIDTEGKLVYFTSQPMQTTLPENESSAAGIEDPVQYLAERYA